jgi:predicted dehydrogenase
LFPTELRLPNNQKVASGFVSPRDPHQPQSIYDSQMAYFLDCIRHNRTPKPGGLEGWTNMRVIDAAYESARMGKVVEL